MFIPVPLCHDWGGGTIPLFESAMETRTFGIVVMWLLGGRVCKSKLSNLRKAVAFYASLYPFWNKGSISPVLSGIVLAGLPLFLVSNLPFYVGYVSCLTCSD